MVFYGFLNYYYDDDENIKFVVVKKYYLIDLCDVILGFGPCMLLDLDLFFNQYLDLRLF